jgi:hypothetical protein
VGKQFTLDSCSLSAAMDGTTGLEDTPFGTGDLDCGEESGLESLVGRLFDGARNVSKVEILVFFVVVESPGSGDKAAWTCSGEGCFDGASSDRRPKGRGVFVAGGERRRCKGI